MKNEIVFLVVTSSELCGRVCFHSSAGLSSLLWTGWGGVCTDVFLLIHACTWNVPQYWGCCMPAWGVWSCHIRQVAFDESCPDSGEWSPQTIVTLQLQLKSSEWQVLPGVGEQSTLWRMYCAVHSSGVQADGIQGMGGFQWLHDSENAFFVFVCLLVCLFTFFVCPDLWRSRSGGGGFVLAREDLGRMFNNSFPTCAFSFFSFFFKWRLAHTHLFHC